jgi:hypothetical protein
MKLDNGNYPRADTSLRRSRGSRRIEIENHHRFAPMYFAPPFASMVLNLCEMYRLPSNGGARQVARGAPLFGTQIKTLRRTRTECAPQLYRVFPCWKIFHFFYYFCCPRSM